MELIGQILANTTITEDDFKKLIPNHSEGAVGYTCLHCQKFIPPLEIELFGIKRMVQPRCTCDWKIYEAQIKEAEERLRQDTIQALFPISKIGERFNNCRFDNYQARKGNERLFQMALQYVEKFDRWEEKSLYIWGEVGNGKTHLAAAITNGLKAKGKTVVFQSVPDLLARIRSTFKKESKETEHQLMQALTRCQLLVLDDMGAEKVSDWTGEELFRIIDGRYQAEKPILFTSNLQISQLADRFDDIQGMRIADRISDITISFENKSSSYRLESAMKRTEAIKKREWID